MSVLHLMSHFCVNVDVASRGDLSSCTLVCTVEALLTLSAILFRHCP